MPAYDFSGGHHKKKGITTNEPLNNTSNNILRAPVQPSIPSNNSSTSSTSPLNIDHMLSLRNNKSQGKQQPPLPGKRSTYLSTQGNASSARKLNAMTTSIGNIEKLVTEGFSEMQADTQRIQTNWLRKVESECLRGYTELAHEVQRFEEEKNAAWLLLAQDRERETARATEERRKIEIEHKNNLRLIQQEREDAKRRLEQDLLEHEEKCKDELGRIHNMKYIHSREVQKFEEERSKIIDTSLAAQNMAELNIGGTIFEANTNSLCQQKGSFLEALLSGRHSVQRDRNDRIFIDRDPDLFRTILNFLRDPSVPPYVTDSAKSVQLVTEAEYFNIKVSLFFNKRG